MKRSALLVAAALTCAVASSASAEVIFPSGTKFIDGVVRWDESEGSWRCKIRCGGLANPETVVGYRFLFAEGGIVSATEWTPDGGTIVCNPFNSFNIGFLYTSQLDAPATCQVGLK